jgi:predicted peroxiredoxin
MPLADLLGTVLASGQVTLCTQCADRRGITADDVLDGVRIAGAAVFAEEVLGEGVQALVY